QDITERKCAEEALREANARLDLAMRGSNIGIWENQFSSGGDLPSSQVTLINILEPLGYESSEIAANHVRMMELVHPDHRERVERESQAYLARGTGEFEIEHPMRHKDGSYRWVLCRGVAVRDAAGKPVRFAGTLMDITERRGYALRQRAIADAASKINASLSVAKPLDATLQLLIDEVRQIIGANVAIAEVSGLGASHQSIMLASLSEW